MNVRTQLAVSLATLFVIVLLPYGPALHAQDIAPAQAATPTCKPVQVTPLTGTEPAAKIHIQVEY
jgi:hypothetical protein